MSWFIFYQYYTSFFIAIPSFVVLVFIIKNSTDQHINIHNLTSRRRLMYTIEISMNRTVRCIVVCLHVQFIHLMKKMFWHLGHSFHMLTTLIYLFLRHLYGNANLILFILIWSGDLQVVFECRCRRRVCVETAKNLTAISVIARTCIRWTNHFYWWIETDANL